MQAIKTKYLHATNYRGSRIKARSERGSITISYPYNKDVQSAHAEAARALIEKFAREDKKKYGTPLSSNFWGGEYVCGSVDNTGYIFVRVCFSDRYDFTQEDK